MTMSLEHHDYLRIASIFSEYSTCPRLYVGAILVRQGRIISSGYNGAPSGLEHCTHGDDGPCSRAVHAEVNTIAFAARYGVSTEGAVLYSTHMPCISCAKLIINSGIVKVVYAEEYRLTEGQEILEEAGVVVVQLDKPKLLPVPHQRGDGTGMRICDLCGATFTEESHRCRRSAGSERGRDGGVVLGPSRTVAEILAERDRDGTR